LPFSAGIPFQYGKGFRASGIRACGKKIREKKGISQTLLVNKIGKDQPSINRLEKGKINPSYIYLLEICEGLEINITELFK
jgi:transcriptional regulator with XRE-family HTH domain